VKRKQSNVKTPIAQFVAIIALTISIFLVVDFGRKAAANYRIQREAKQLSQQVEAAQRYQSRLLAQRTYAASDLYVEEVARKELKWAKPGETVVVVLATPEAQHPIGKAGAQRATPATATSPLEAWIQLFFGNDSPHNPL